MGRRLRGPRLGPDLEQRFGGREQARSMSGRVSGVSGLFQDATEQRQDLKFQWIHCTAHYRHDGDTTVWPPF